MSYYLLIRLSCLCLLRVRPPFPTRRTSDLNFCRVRSLRGPRRRRRSWRILGEWPAILRRKKAGRRGRSEEHTSELQSHVNLVCRLLLEKKKGQWYRYTTTNVLTAYHLLTVF